MTRSLGRRRDVPRRRRRADPRSRPAPLRAVDRTLDRYVPFVFDTLNFKGGENGRGLIKGGDVGANGVDSDPTDSAPVLNLCSNFHTTMDAGSQVVADTMRLTANCQVWDVYTNQLLGSPPVVPKNSGPNSFTAPILANPSFPAFSCSAANPVHVDKRATTTLPPGTYGDVFIGDDAHVTLQPGLYTMCDFQTGNNVKVTTVPGVELRIERTFGLNGHTTFGLACDVPVSVRGDGSNPSNDTTIAFSHDTDVHGRFLTLLGKINLGESSDLTGAFVGNKIVSDQNVNVTGCGGGTTTTTGAPTTVASTSTTTTSTTSTSSTTTSTTSTTVPSTSTSTSTTTSTSSTSTTIPETSTSTTSTTVRACTAMSASTTAARFASTGHTRCATSRTARRSRSSPLTARSCRLRMPSA